MRRHTHFKFSEVPTVAIQRSFFNRSHCHKTTLNAGYLYPLLVDEVLPGDTFDLHTELFIRVNPTIVPIMDNLTADLFCFYVPNRLLWNNFERMYGAQDNPNDTTDYLIPQVVNSSPSGYATGSLQDYMGIPVGKPVSVNALPLRAYNKIWNEWFRDQNLQNSVPVSLGDNDSVNNYTLLRRGKRHDYFTSCLPWPQKGNTVNLPLGGTANILGSGAINLPSQSGGTISANGIWGGAQNVVTNYQAVAPGDPTPVTYYQGQKFFGGSISATGNTNPNPVGSDFSYVSGLKSTIGGNITYNSISGLYADLSQATAATINDLRLAFQTQRYLEKNARGGTRYVEHLMNHWRVRSPDGRLQRSEYLGGGSCPILMQAIPQTSSTDATSPQGNLSAYGVANMSKQGFKHTFLEHGVLMVLVSIRAPLTYQQGLSRMWSRRTKFDLYLPVMAHLGEQAVLNKEIYHQGISIDDDVFGYQERWAEYRYHPDKVTGLMRSNVTAGNTSLQYWHLAQNFPSLPKLNSSFIEENPPMSRILAVPSQPAFLLDSFFKLKCYRPMPIHSVPGMIDHF